VTTTETVPTERRDGKLAALEERYKHELLNPDERLDLRDRINRLKGKAETTAETVDVHHSGLERMDG
jgi:hypothetical protein